VPKRPSDETTEGTAWVDQTTATILSAGFKLSRPGFLVDYVHVTLEFTAQTDLGSGLSRVTFDSAGGLLFFRKHVRGEARLSDYRMAP
jgi:hypothetical protein